MENECAEHICIDMEILMMTKLIMPLPARYPGAPMNSIEKALESERAIISGGHLMYFSPQQNCHPQHLSKIHFPRVILNRRDAHRIPIQQACPSQRVCSDDALSGKCKREWGNNWASCAHVLQCGYFISIAHSHKSWCTPVLLCNGTLSWWYYSRRTLDILEWHDYSIILSHCVA